MFGSQARGTADEHSDVDLLVIGSYKQRKIEVIREMLRSLDDLVFPIDQNELLRCVKQWPIHADEDLTLAKHALTLSSGCPYRLIA